MTLSMRGVMTGEKELLAMLTDIPQRATRITRAAQKRVGELVASRGSTNTPRGRVAPHMADQYGVKQKVYRASGIVVTIVGVKSPSNLAHIVEEGTAARYTNHKSEYEKRVIGKMTRTRRVRTASGGWRTIRERVDRIAWRSKGSKWKGTAVPNYRGIMPAFRPLKKAVDQTNIIDSYENELRAGLQRIADRYAAASG